MLFLGLSGAFKDRFVCEKHTPPTGLPPWLNVRKTEAQQGRVPVDLFGGTMQFSRNGGAKKIDGIPLREPDLHVFFDYLVGGNGKKENKYLIRRSRKSLEGFREILHRTKDLNPIKGEVRRKVQLGSNPYKRKCRRNGREKRSDSNGSVVVLAKQWTYERTRSRRGTKSPGQRPEAYKTLGCEQDRVGCPCPVAVV